ncbi:MAG: hypothetical protein EOO46_21180 [Flavobacterium sp.]|nr:MAG: hypothetical protein EOO46_21180 [Flavobacterium sp.]
MKKKYAIVNLVLMIAVLFAILFQSVHSYEHILEQKTSYSQNDTLKTDVHVNDHHHGKCFVCEFTFSSFIESNTVTIASKLVTQVEAYTIFYTETPSVFSGNSTSQRGPPQII